MLGVGCLLLSKALAKLLLSNLMGVGEGVCDVADGDGSGGGGGGSGGGGGGGCGDGDDCVQLTLSLNDSRSTRSMKDSLALSDV